MPWDFTIHSFCGFFGLLFFAWGFGFVLVFFVCVPGSCLGFFFVVVLHKEQLFGNRNSLTCLPGDV